MRNICGLVGVFLGALAGIEISRTERIIAVYEKCFVVAKSCTEREIIEGEVQLQLLSGYLIYYVIGALVFVGAGEYIKHKKRSNTLNKSESWW